jgi:hypothetical protein
LKILLIQYIQCKDSDYPKAIYKLLENNSIPHAGDFINDSVWKEPTQYEVKEVSIDYSYNRCEVLLSKCEEEWDAFEKFAGMAKLHGWNDGYPLKFK